MKDDTSSTETGAAEQRRMTTDPERIKEWAEARDAVPVLVRDSEDHGHSFAHRDELGETHEEYTWDEFNNRFEDEDLVFVHHEGEPTGEGLGFFEIVEREQAFDRADLGRDELEDSLRRGETVTTEIVETQVIEQEIVERDTIESEVVDTDLVEQEVIDSELLSREIIDTEFIDDDLIELVVDETFLETIEEIERYTVESRVVDVDIEQDETLEHDETEAVETDIELDSVQRSILESDVVRSDVMADEVVEREVIQSQRTEGDTVRSELLERRTVEEEVAEQMQMRYTLEETELLESEVVASDVIEGEIIGVEEYGATDTTAETEASAGTDTPTVDTGPVELSSDDQGKDVVDETGQQIGIVAEVEGQTAYIDPEPGLTDRLKARLNWGGHGDDDYPVDSSAIDQITDDEVILESDDE